jgi:O-antigen ligase
LQNPIVHFPDSPGYLDADIIRSPGYPLFLNLIQFLFGNFFETALIVIQLSIGLAAIYYFVDTIRKHFSFHIILVVLFTIALLFPYYINGRIANNVLSEALAYALYLVVLARFIHFLVDQNRKTLLYTLPWLFFLILVRSQFLYLIPLAILMIIWICVKQRAWKKYRISLVLYLLLPFLVSLADKTYHKLQHDHFVSTPWTGIHVAAPGFYIANAEDATIFEEAKEQEIFNNIHTKLTAQSLTAASPIDLEKSSPASRFILNYTTIANKTIFKTTYASLDTTFTRSERIIQTDAITKKMAPPLAMHNFSSWLKLYYKNVVFGFGSIEYFLLHLFILLIAFVTMLKKNTIVSTVLFVITAAALLNVLTISIGIHAVFRYTFYNDWVVFLVVFLLVNEWWKKRILE